MIIVILMQLKSINPELYKIGVVITTIIITVHVSKFFLKTHLL